MIPIRESQQWQLGLRQTAVPYTLHVGKWVADDIWYTYVTHADAIGIGATDLIHHRRICWHDGYWWTSQCGPQSMRDVPVLGYDNAQDYRLINLLWGPAC